MFNKIKGTRDLNPIEMDVHEFIRGVFVKIVKSYNFSLIDTPIIEHCAFINVQLRVAILLKKKCMNLLIKEIVNALRPEGTAGFVRALVENTNDIRH